MHAGFSPTLPRLRMINSNNTDSLATKLTGDVVFLPAGENPMVGKAAVRARIDAYYKAFKTKWNKPVQEFLVSGDVARSSSIPEKWGAELMCSGSLSAQHNSPATAQSQRERFQVALAAFNLASLELGSSQG